MSEELCKYNFWAFVAFEFCIGVYFPAICTIKSEAVPESCRATVYNLFRAPMNLIVVSVLLTNLELMATFRLVSLMLLFSALTSAVILYLPEDKARSYSG